MDEVEPDELYRIGFLLSQQFLTEGEMTKAERYYYGEDFGGDLIKSKDHCIRITVEYLPID